MTAIPFAEGFMKDISVDPYDATFVQSVCRDCGTGFFGTKNRCENCASQELETGTLDPAGEIFTFTVQRYPPPEPYKMGSTDRESWEPQPVAYADFDGVRLLGLVDADEEDVDIGTPVELVVEPGWESDDGDEVLIYKFALRGEGQ